MNLKEHENRCRKQFGKPYTEIHKFLDQYMDPSYPVHLHRRIFHHQMGVELVVAIFGPEAKEPAIQHIRDDGLVREDVIIRDWNDWDWIYFRGQKDIEEQAILLKKWYGELFTV